MKVGTVVVQQKELAFLATRLGLVAILSNVITVLILISNAENRALALEFAEHLEDPFLQRMEITLAPKEGARPIGPIFERIRQRVAPLPFEVLSEDPPQFAVIYGGIRPKSDPWKQIESIWEEGHWYLIGSLTVRAPPHWDEMQSLIPKSLALASVVGTGMLGLAGLLIWRDRPPFRTLFALPSARAFAKSAAIVAAMLASAEIYYRLVLFFFGEPSTFVPWEAVIDHLGLAGAAGVVALAGVGEEIFFRGYALHFLKERIGVRSAVVITSLVFALGHLQPTFIPFFFGFGVVLALVALRTKSLFLPIFIHAAYNGILILAS